MQRLCPFASTKNKMCLFILKGLLFAQLRGDNLLYFERFCFLEKVNQEKSTDTCVCFVVTLMIIWFIFQMMALNCHCPSKSQNEGFFAMLIVMCTVKPIMTTVTIRQEIGLGVFLFLFCIPEQLGTNHSEVWCLGHCREHESANTPTERRSHCRCE